MLENFLQLKDDHIVETFGEQTMNPYSQMVADLAKPGEDIIATLTPAIAHTLHMAIGLAGEAGELLEHYNAAGVKIIPDSEIIEELGDAEFYFEGLCQSMHIEIALTGCTSNDSLCIPRYVVATTDMLDLVKKMVIYNKDIDLMDFVDNLTKVRMALDQAYGYYGFTQPEALEHNMNKLLKGYSARYKEGVYSDEAAQSRRDKQGAVEERMFCPVLRKHCDYYGYHCNSNEEIVLEYCQHPGNTNEFESNCTAALCPILQEGKEPQS
ncbi:MAG: hypothetical protein GY814_17945 [Gammaproteobacteria bacterium]|nr:hypothetical protein [Gammaproteobacteria bacterium]